MVMTLENGALIGLQGVLNARLNELDTGTYSLCLATLESKGDYERDFHTTLGRFVVQGIRVAPTLHLPPTVSFGSELLVHWTAGDGRTTHAQDWIGLYLEGSCPELALHDGVAFPAGTDTTAPVNQNQCHLATEQLPEGVAAGTVRFSAEQYGMKQGRYEARYFQGDSRDGQGVVCRRLQGSEEYFKYCALETVAVSAPAEVVDSLADGTYEYSQESEKMAGLGIVIDKDTWQMG